MRMFHAVYGSVSFSDRRDPIFRSTREVGRSPHGAAPIAEIQGLRMLERFMAAQLYFDLALVFRLSSLIAHIISPDVRSKRRVLKTSKYK